MSKKLAFGGVVLALVVAAFGCHGLRSINYFAWRDHQPSNVRILAASVQCYESDHGAYPSNLLQVVTNENSSDRELIGRILSGFTRYSYWRTNEGFAIAAEIPGSLLQPKDRIEVCYPFGYDPGGVGSVAVSTNAPERPPAPIHETAAPGAEPRQK